MKLRTVHFIPASMVYGENLAEKSCPSCGKPIAEIEVDPLHLLTSSSYAYKHMNQNYKACDDDGIQDSSGPNAEQGGLAKD